MNLRRLLVLVSLFATGHSVAQEADITPPTFTWQNPAAGSIQPSDSITVSGTATDPTQAAVGTGATVVAQGIKRVEYRLAGSKKWKTTILIPGTTTGTGSSATTSGPTWVFTLKLGKGKSTWVSVRAIDLSGNESDIVSRQIKRSRTSR